MASLANWTSRRWATALFAAAATFFAIGLPTDVIANPVFGRPVDVTWWSYPVLAATAVLAGLLVATYVSDAPVNGLDASDDLDRPGRAGGVGGLLSFFAVGCPTCNKLAVVALGSSGAIDWFAPAQPLLAFASLGLLGWALRARLQGATECRIAG